MMSSAVSSMRVLRVADVANNRSGGMARAMYGTGDVLCARGHHVDYLFADRMPTGFPISLRRFVIPLYILRFIWRLQRHGIRYDVVEVHEPLAAPLCAFRCFGERVPPVVVFSHGLEECGHRAELDYFRQKNLSVSLKRRWSPLSVIWQAMFAARRADHVLCCSSADVAYLSQAGVNPSKLTQNQNGVDTELANAGEQDGEDAAGHKRILFFGTWLLRKGILDLTEAVSRVMQAHPVVSLTIAGCGASSDTVLAGFAPALRARIDVIPHVEGTACLSEIYRRHEIFVLPSYFEGQPLVMFEAAAFGLAIIATNVCGMADFIEDGVNGYAVPVGDVAALTARLEGLIAHPELARRLGDAARRRAQEFTWEASAAKVEQAYRNASVRQR